MSFTRLTAVALFLLTAGCIPSLHSIYTKDDLVFEPEIVGFWKLENSPQTWDFTKRDDKSYNLVFTDEHGQSGRFIAHLCQVEDTVFLDLFPEQKEAEPVAFYKYHLLPIHTVYMVKETHPSLEFVSLDLNWLKQHLDLHPDALSHSTYDNRLLITASTGELQQFLLKYKDRFTGAFRLKPHTAQTTPTVTETSK